MEDIRDELRKLDPHRLLGHLHYSDEFEEGEEVILDHYDSLRYVTESEMSKDYKWMLENINPAITIEVVCPGVTYWLIIPVKFPTSRSVKKMHCDVILSLGMFADSSYGIKGIALSRNRDLVPDVVVPVMGDFYAKKH